MKADVLTEGVISVYLGFKFYKRHKDKIAAHKQRRFYTEVYSKMFRYQLTWSNSWDKVKKELSCVYYIGHLDQGVDGRVLGFPSAGFKYRQIQKIVAKWI